MSGLKQSTTLGLTAALHRLTDDKADFERVRDSLFATTDFAATKEIPERDFYRICILVLIIALHEETGSRAGHTLAKVTLWELAMVVYSTCIKPSESDDSPGARAVRALTEVADFDARQNLSEMPEGPERTAMELAMKLRESV